MDIENYHAIRNIGGQTDYRSINPEASVQTPATTDKIDQKTILIPSILCPSPRGRQSNRLPRIFTPLECWTARAASAALAMITDPSPLISCRLINIPFLPSFSKKKTSRIWVCHDVCPDQSPKSGGISFQVLGLFVHKQTHH
jgi:hypothetical protein